MPTTLRGFYTDMKYGPAYFTFISQELPELCEQFFRLSPLREDRFAAGLSMGGYGAIKLGLLCQRGRFSAVASLSGALDVVGGAGLRVRLRHPASGILHHLRRTRAGAGKRKRLVCRRGPRGGIRRAPSEDLHVVPVTGGQVSIGRTAGSTNASARRWASSITNAPARTNGSVGDEHISRRARLAASAHARAAAPCRMTRCGFALSMRPERFPPRCCGLVFPASRRLSAAGLRGLDFPRLRIRRRPSSHRTPTSGLLKITPNDSSGTAAIRLLPLASEMETLVPAAWSASFEEDALRGIAEAARHP